MKKFEDVFYKLIGLCQESNYAGYDPFDGLNSKLFQVTPFKNSRFFRLAWTQFFKRSPLNFRQITAISVGKNPKGIALFALAWLEIFQKTKSEKAKNESLKLINFLLENQINPESKVENQKSAWGYNFDWQGRSFFAPQGTPTIVPTAFVARALLTGYKIFGDEIFLKTSQQICNFILEDLHRTHETATEICFSYSPIDKTRVFNASLLAGEVLAEVGNLTNNDEFKNFAVRCARYVVNRQNSDGSWVYGGDSFQTWADNFHTAFVLSSLKRILTSCNVDEFNQSVAAGLSFWKDNFFLEDGLPKYYHNKIFPIDCHSSGAAIATLCEFGEVEFAQKVANWTIENMLSPTGFFYYQRHKLFTNKIPYMRWTQSWMAYGLAKLVEN